MKVLLYGRDGGTLPWIRDRFTECLGKDIVMTTDKDEFCRLLLEGKEEFAFDKISPFRIVIVVDHFMEYWQDLVRRMRDEYYTKLAVICLISAICRHKRKDRKELERLVDIFIQAPVSEEKARIAADEMEKKVDRIDKNRYK